MASDVFFNHTYWLLYNTFCEYCTNNNKDVSMGLLVNSCENWKRYTRTPTLISTLYPPEVSSSHTRAHTPTHRHTHTYTSALTHKLYSLTSIHTLPEFGHPLPFQSYQAMQLATLIYITGLKNINDIGWHFWGKKSYYCDLFDEKWSFWNVKGWGGISTSHQGFTMWHHTTVESPLFTLLSP